MPGIPGMGKRGRQPAPQRTKSKSGNPAKRAADAREAAQRAASKPAGGAGGAFGAGAGGGIPTDLDPSALPKGFEKFLGKS